MGDKIIILVGEDHLYLGARPGTTSVLRSSWGLRHLKLDLKLIQHYMALVANKVVCITGSSRGIGRACVLDFVKHGASALILHYLGDEETEAEIKSLQKEVKSKGAQVVTVAGDIGDPATSSMVRSRFSFFLS
ncbi:hypothetical protein C0993_012571 [Termitomyces sp. T159_Od127]|nr:hypothetical protein C0993_012571 [Termitomyces sp. T159_Od127]